MSMTEVERAERRVAQAQRDLERAQAKEREREEKRLRAIENNKLGEEAAKNRASYMGDMPVLLIAASGDWCQLEVGGQIKYNGHLSDLDPEMLAALLGISLNVEQDAPMIDGRNFA